MFVVGCESPGLAVAGTLGSQLCPAVLQVAGEGLLGAGTRVGLEGLPPSIRAGRREVQVLPLCFPSCSLAMQDLE